MFGLVQFEPLKPVAWLGDSLRLVRSLPSGVQDELGYALFLAKRGEKHVAAKPLQGLAAGVMKVVADHATTRFAPSLPVRLADRIYVLHASQKKSKRGIATPQAEIELIKRWLKQAMAISEGRQ